MSDLKVPSKSKMASRSKSSLSSKSGLQSKSRTGSKVDLKRGSKSNMARSQLRARSKLLSGSQARMGDDSEEWLEAKDPVKPDDQLELDEEELKKEYTRILNANNPYAPDNIVRFSFKELVYKQSSTVEQTAFHFAIDGNMIHKESDEARRQNARESMNVTRSSGTTTEEGEGAGEGEENEDEEEGEEEDEGVADEGEGGEEEAKPEGAVEEASDAPVIKKPLRNQFNFSERASQTYTKTHKERGVMTEPPPRAKFSATINQWTIYDAYIADQERQAAAKEAEGKKKENEKSSVKKLPAESERLVDENGSPWSAAAQIVPLSSAKKMERMVNQNTYDDVLQDFAYWEDPSDEFKPNEGSLLPLWKFANEKTKKMTVTSLLWNSRYVDGFLAGYGSYDSQKQSVGYISMYSTKNPSYPEYLIKTVSGVMCIDVHPEQASLLAVGLYDGSVEVYDLASETPDIALYKATAKTGKHTDPVWQVKWQADDFDKNKTFCSVSSDGRVSLWTLVKTELMVVDVVKLNLTTEETTDEPLLGLAAGTCFAFQPNQPNIFVVGTEEGVVHKCSKAYSSKYLASYQAHNMPVYGIQWNPFDPDVFITCSADWRVKIWDHKCPEPMFTFDLGNSVGSVAWAPYSSTVFAAITTDGKVNVFDLSINKYEPVCQQQIVRKAKLTHVAFNPQHGMIIVGDDRGSVTSLKLSPNLRKVLKAKKLPTAEEQKEALNKILASVIDGSPKTE